MSQSLFNDHDATQHLRYVPVEKTNPKAILNPTKKHVEKISSVPLFSGQAHQVIKEREQQQQKERERQLQNPKRNKFFFTQTSPQYGLLGLQIPEDDRTPDHRQLIYANVSAPWSAFICGTQGSGKSHTLSCLLENALIPSAPVNRVTSPLAGLVLHYDKFTAFSKTQICEAAYLCSSGIPVRVLVSPTNYFAMKKAYESIPKGKGGNKSLQVLPMYLSQKHLTITMMKTLMGVGSGKEQPLYMGV